MLELEILTGDGRIVVATPEDEHGDLFRGFPNSYGTLGYALRLTIELEPVRPYVQLRHLPFADADACIDAVAEVAATGHCRGRGGRLRGRHGVRARRALPLVGTHSDVAPYASDYTGQQIYYRSIRQAPRGLPHHPRLPVALGHRLVLVLDGRSAYRARWCGACGRAMARARTSTGSWSPSSAATG